MLTEKTAAIDEAKSAEPAEVVTEHSQDPKSESVRNAELVSLEIDEDSDFGSDPYNSTGHFVMIEIKDYE